jgi:hypothetical protein
MNDTLTPEERARVKGISRDLVSELTARTDVIACARMVVETVGDEERHGHAMEFLCEAIENLDAIINKRKGTP